MKNQYQASRRAAALPRWKRIYEMRKSGMKFREIADELGISIPRIFRQVEAYREHQLNTRTP
jgi:transposase-like protein